MTNAVIAGDFDTNSSLIPSKYEAFFTKDEQGKIEALAGSRDIADINTFPPSCKTNLFFGVFFDGTNNNLKRDRPNFAHSNVARLYEAFPGGKDKHESDAWKNIDIYPNYFRTYVPGVGTPFDEVNDSGTGFSPLFSDRAAGLAFARHGQARILWALAQMINNVSRYYTGNSQIRANEFQDIFRKLELTGPHDTARSILGLVTNDAMKFDDAFGTALRSLHSNLARVLPRPDDQSPMSMDKGWVKEIYFSCFGFSRGAAAARAFTNWFVRLCELDARISGRQGMTLGGIRVKFDFLGLFDTVASVGLANSFVGIPDGHQAWAAAEDSLRIPEASRVQNCLHLVSAHEVRRSFPLDSVAYRDEISSHIKEVVYPGVHSDIGGGYGPCEQGRGTDRTGRDKLSRIPLAHMYRAARLAGVPLKLELAPESVRESFVVDRKTAETFNAYLEACITSEPAPLHKIMQTQHLHYIQWRKHRLHDMETLESVRRSDKHDRTDILEANKELQAEVIVIKKWAEREEQSYETQNAPPCPEWPLIAPLWDTLPTPSPAHCDLFENYVHDSRAWFKPFGKDIPDLAEDLRKAWVDRVYERLERSKQPDRPGDLAPAAPDPLEIEFAAWFANNMEDLRNKGILRQMVEPCLEGREPLGLGGGYIRFRRIYFGSDSWRPYGANY